MNTNRFTIRKQPYIGESLWGFLFRLSQANGIQLLSLLNHIRKSKATLQNSEVSILDFAPESLIDILKFSLLTQRQENCLTMTLHNVSSKFSNTANPARSRYLAGMIRDYYAYCPSCLSEKTYYRLHWRIADITLCPSHGTQILEVCGHCSKTIKFHELTELDTCPHCRMRLNECKDLNSSTDSQFDKSWLVSQWSSLISTEFEVKGPLEIAQKILYVLNDRSSIFQKAVVRKNLPNPNTLASILQHARGSIQHERALHLSFILSTLQAKQIAITQFLRMELPSEFLESLNTTTQSAKINRVSCRAPWCKSYKKTGSLIKTGTAVKTRKNKQSMYYYLACTDCGCEYGFNSSGDMAERSYFIQAFNTMRNLKLDWTNLRNLKEQTKFTEDKLRRCLAYFAQRQIFSCTGLPMVETDEMLENQFICEIQTGGTINTIRLWDCWKNYFHYLLHRYHPAVMQTLIEIKRERPDNVAAQFPCRENRAAFSFSLTEKFLLDCRMLDICKRQLCEVKKSRKTS